MANPSANAGTATYLAITLAAGTALTDVSNYVQRVTPTYNAAEHDTTTMGNTEKQFISGFKEQEYTVEGIWDTTLDGYIFPLIGGTAALMNYGPAGTATGKAKHAGSAVWLSYSPPSDVNAAVTWSGRFRISGGVTRTTF